MQGNEKSSNDGSVMDWDELRSKSVRSGGFGSERVMLWTKLLNVHQLDIDEKSGVIPLRDKSVTSSLDVLLEEHGDERQIKLDTDRSFVLYPVDDMTEKERLQLELHELIVSLFRRRRCLSYFQGYHDIVSVVYLTMPEELQLVSVEKLSLHRLRDSMGSTLEPVIALLRVLKRLLSVADPNYAELLNRISPLPYYALSNLLTLFSHDMPTLALAQHVFDYLLSRPPISSVYLAAAIILSRNAEVELLEQEGEEGMIHSLLSGLPDLFEDVEDKQSEIIPEEPQEPGAVSPPNIEQLTVEKAEAYLASGALPEVSPSQILPSEAVVKPAISVSDDIPLIEPTIPLKQESGQADFLSDGIPNEIQHQQVVSDSLQTSSIPPVLESSMFRPPTPPSPLPRRPHISLSSLLRHADLLYDLYPPTHPSIALDTIMGPQSVVFTWSQNQSQLPDDDEAELMVTRPELIVRPAPEEEEEARKEEEQKEEKRRRRRLRKPRRLIPVKRKAMVASAVLVLGIAVAVYGTGGLRGGRWAESHRAGHKDWRSLTRFVGALFVGAGERFLDEIWGQHGA